MNTQERGDRERIDFSSTRRRIAWRPFARTSFDENARQLLPSPCVFVYRSISTVSSEGGRERNVRVVVAIVPVSSGGRVILVVVASSTAPMILATRSRAVVLLVPSPTPAIALVVRPPPPIVVVLDDVVPVSMLAPRGTSDPYRTTTASIPIILPRFFFDLSRLLLSSNPFQPGQAPNIDRLGL